MRLGISNQRNLQGFYPDSSDSKDAKTPKSFYYFFFDGPSILEPKTGDKKPLFRLRLAVLEPVFYAEIQALGNLTRLRC